MLAIMVVAGIAGTACLGATRAISEVPWGAYGSLAAPTAGNRAMTRVSCTFSTVPLERVEHAAAGSTPRRLSISWARAPSKSE